MNLSSLALLLSDLFSPLLFFTYAALLSDLPNFFPLLLLSFAFFAYLPQRIIEKTGTRKGSSGSQRWMMQSQFVASFFVGLALLVWLDAPRLVLAYSVALSVGQLIVLAFVPVWKISGHAFGTAASAAFLYSFGALAVLPAVVLFLLFGWGRVSVGAHTVAQYVAGGLGGLLVAFLSLSFAG